jgi:Na+-transporting NADH:ubiquinone oxidoreductase subunit NqrB
MNSTLILLIIAAVAVAAFWRAILKVGIAAIIVGFAFLLITGLLEILHGLQALLH